MDVKSFCFACRLFAYASDGPIKKLWNQMKIWIYSAADF